MNSYGEDSKRKLHYLSLPALKHNDALILLIVPNALEKLKG